MRVVVQIGFMKSAGRRRVGQLVRAYLNDNEMSWNDTSIEGRYLTSKMEAAKGVLWYLCNMDLNESDTLRMEVKTSVAKVGTDESRTFESLYYVNPDAPVREIIVSGVGVRGYPLIKGRVLEMGSVSEADKRKSDVDEFLRGGF